MAAIVSQDAEFFLTRLLREVSRSFYLTLRVLPRPIRPQIGFAYLLARATDTVADTEAVPPQERLLALARLRDRILASRPGPIDFGELSACQLSDGEKLLLTRIDEILHLVFQFPEDDLQRIQRVLEVITHGQMLDLERFGYSHVSAITALQTPEELDDYTYQVAGCVGEFWTEICIAHLRPRPGADLDELRAKGIRFGRGLQLVNILRDIPADLRKGRCYLPASQLEAIGLHPADLLDPKKESALRPIYDQWLELACDHLVEGWSYVQDLPWRWGRVRLACAWPILIGIRTVALLRQGPVLDPGTRMKISRRELNRILLSSTLTYPLPFLWRRLADLPD